MSHVSNVQFVTMKNGTLPQKKSLRKKNVALVRTVAFVKKKGTFGKHLGEET